MLIAVTPTGHRPKALAALARRVAAAGRHAPDLWIIADDGDPLSKVDRPINTFHGRRRPFWKPGQITLKENISYALKLADAHIPNLEESAAVMILEDDDWYAPQYFEGIRKALAFMQSEVLGVPFARYFNVRSLHALENMNDRHASLSNTIVRGSAIWKLKELCKGNPDHFIDIPLWDWAMGTGRGTLLPELSQFTVGVKGLPGRPGIGIGHRPEMGYYRPDAVNWLGADADEYLRMVD